MFSSVLAICEPLAAQTSAAADASQVFAYDATKPLNLTIGKSETPAIGVSVFEVSYDSPRGGRVPAYLVVPSGTGPFPAIVYMHWGQGNKEEFLSEAVEMAQRGAIGIMIDAPYWRPDVPPPEKGKEAESERDSYLQMVVDLRRTVGVLVSRKDIDPERIGYVGHSLGATWGAAGRCREADQGACADGWVAESAPRLERRQLLPAGAACRNREGGVR
jgi:dienelactone hydrolase